MLPVKSNLLPTISRFFEEDWNSMFDWSNRNLTGAETSLPAVNIKEMPDSFLVEMAAPGMSKEDFHIELHNNLLTIKSEKKTENEVEEGENYTRREFSYQSFQRSFNLNNKVVDDGNIMAKYENGILYITLPKKEEAKEKPARMIEIS